MVEEERVKAAGRARLAKDTLDMSRVRTKESEQKALADQALVEFAVKEGILLKLPPPEKLKDHSAEGPGS
jgi:hypothetical protein